MRIIYFFLGIVLALAGCRSEKSVSVNVSNATDFDRNNEIVEISIDEVVEKLQLADTAEIVILDEDGRQLPYQITFDNKIIFPAAVKAKGQSGYTIKAGIPEIFAVTACGKEYSDRENELVWENDRMAFRMDGPEAEQLGGICGAYGILVKNSGEPVLEMRYQGLENAQKGFNGGGGTVVQAEGDMLGSLVCQSQEILDNGPLRFTVMLTYAPIVVKGDSNVVETRIISLDKGSQLNKILVFYKNLGNVCPLATGIALYENGGTEYVAETKKGYMGAMCHPADTTGVTGAIYTGAVFPANVTKIEAVDGPVTRKCDGKSGSYLLATGNYQPESDYVYYWGAGWSKYGFDKSETWIHYLDEFARRVRNPLTVNIQ